MKFEVYKYYVTAMSSACAAITILLNFTQQAFIVASGYWLSVWSNDMSVAMKNDDPNRKVKEYFYLGVYALLGFCQGE